MHLLVILLTMAILPGLTVAADVVLYGSPVLPAVGQWFVFWGVGVRLAMAGIKQVRDPAFTARGIFGITDDRSLILVQELGFANLALGLLGLVAGACPSFVLPGAVAGGTSFALAGVRHAMKGERNGHETLAMISDLAMAALLAAFAATWAAGA